MTIKTWVATFSDGERIDRTSSHNYAFCWRVIASNGKRLYGFSSTRNLADYAARNNARWQTGKSEVVQCEVGAAPDKTTLPWRIKRTRPNGIQCGYVRGKGNSHIRFATEAEAKAYIIREGGDYFTYVPTDQ